LSDAHGNDSQQLARTVTDAVGDGCVVRMLEPATGRLRTVAIAHRDPSGRNALAPLLDAPPHVAAGWEAQVMDRALPLRLEGSEAADVIGADAHLTVAAAALLPLRREGVTVGVIVALRDSYRYPYTLRDQHILEHTVLALRTNGSAPSQEVSRLGPERVLDHVDSGVWVTDRQGATMHVNDAMCRLLGAPADALVGEPMADFIDAPPAVVLGRTGDRAERRDHRLMRPDGADTWVAASSVELTDPEGRRTGTVTTVTDITERKVAEVELRMRLAAHEAVAELSDWTLAGEPVESLVHGVAAAVADLLDVEHVAVAEASERPAEVIPRAIVGWDLELIGRPVPVPPTSAALVALECEGPVVVRDLEAEGPYEPSPSLVAAGMRSSVLMGVGDGLGLISAHSPQVDAFAGRDLSFLRSLAELLALRWAPADSSRLATAPGV